jgi:hypothetical protein
VHRIGKGSLRSLAIGLVLVLLVAVAPACGGDSGPKGPPIPATFMFKGDVRLSGASYVYGDLANCSGLGPYADIYKGAFVTVTNQVGKPIAIGRVAYGLGTNYYQDVLDECTFRLDIFNVPRAKAYLVVVGRSVPAQFSLASVVATSGVLVFDANPPLVRPGVQL